ncbi:MAG: hypothetical protein QME35_10160 [Thermoanaerobacteraceae bacterium]|nr:hypothetical protein [Thermoanaerobacteraceae bacterium]
MIKVMMEGFKLYNHNKWRREKIMEYSSKHMKEMIKYAYTFSNFYKTLYKGTGIKYEKLDNISIGELPVIDKEMVRNNFFDIVTDSISHREIEMAMKNSELMVRIGKYILVHTSGSTGKPCNFLYDVDALDMIEANMVRKNGGKDFLHPLFIDDLEVDGIKEYQFIKTSDESFILNCVKLPHTNGNVEEEIKRQLDQFLSKKKLRNVKYKIHFKEMLQIDKKTGKVKMFIDITTKNDRYYY